ncbi:MAG: TrkA family potassium uptake protein [Kofleriaceae bacterium]
MKFVVSPLNYLIKQPLVRENLARLARLFLVLFVMVAVSSILFHFIMLYEGRDYSYISGVYWTLTVMSTLGFGDITFSSDLGRAFSIVVLICGIVMLLIVLPFAFIRFFYAPWVEAHMRLRAPRSVPEGTKGHVVICKNDAIAVDLAERLQLAKIPYFVLETDPTVAAHMHGDGIPVITGDPQHAATWEAVAVKDVLAVVANTTDPENTNILLTVRHVAPDVSVITTADSDDSVDILELSGSSHVLPVKRRLGEHLANRVNAGHAEVHTIGRYRDLVIGEFPVHRTPLVGRSLRDLGLRKRMGISVVGVWERGRFEPATPDRVLTAHSVPVVIGTEVAIMELNALLVIYDTNYDATVIIGGGKVGAAATRALKARELCVHVVEQDAVAAAKLEGVADEVFVGPAADRDVLIAAGIDKAPAVILTTNDDSINIYLTVYCRKLNPELRIISRITHEQNLEAVHRAGADFVLSYSSLGAESVFSIVQGRGVMMFGAGIELFHVGVPEPLVGKTLEECAIGKTCGVNVIAVQDGDQTVTNPPPTQTLPANAELLMLGTHEQRQSFTRLFHDRD